MHTKKRFGQHLLKDPADARRIAELVSQQASDAATILEIGPGRGALTVHLLELCAQKDIVAVEFDRDMVAELRESFPALQVIQQDILDYNPAELKSPAFVAGNLPYNISAPIIEWTVQNRNTIGGAVYMLQREVADRLAGQPGSKDWSPLAIFTQLYFEVNKEFNLQPSKFIPPPKVHSSVVTLRRRDLLQIPLPNNFESVVRAAFSARRKQLANNLKTSLGLSTDLVNASLEATKLAANIRAEQISIAKFIELSQYLDRRV